MCIYIYIYIYSYFIRPPSRALGPHPLLFDSYFNVEVNNPADVYFNVETQIRNVLQALLGLNGIWFLFII